MKRRLLLSVLMVILLVLATGCLKSTTTVYHKDASGTPDAFKIHFSSGANWAIVVLTSVAVMGAGVFSIVQGQRRRVNTAPIGVMVILSGLGTGIYWARDIGSTWVKVTADTLTIKADAPDPYTFDLASVVEVQARKKGGAWEDDPDLSSDASWSQYAQVQFSLPDDSGYIFESEPLGAENTRLLWTVLSSWRDANLEAIAAEQRRAREEAATAFAPDPFPDTSDSSFEPAPEPSYEPPPESGSE